MGSPMHTIPSKVCGCSSETLHQGDLVFGGPKLLPSLYRLVPKTIQYHLFGVNSLLPPRGPETVLAERLETCPDGVALSEGHRAHAGALRGYLCETTRQSERCTELTRKGGKCPPRICATDS